MAKYEIKDGVGIIPEGTERIEYGEFMDCEELTSIILPESLSYIAPNAFLGCKNLKRIVVSKVVERIVIPLGGVSDLTIFRPFSKLIGELIDGRGAYLKKQYDCSWRDWD